MADTFFDQFADAQAMQTLLGILGKSGGVGQRPPINDMPHMGPPQETFGGLDPMKASGAAPSFPPSPPEMQQPPFGGLDPMKPQGPAPMFPPSEQPPAPMAPPSRGIGSDFAAGGGMMPPPMGGPPSRGIGSDFAASGGPMPPPPPMVSPGPAVSQGTPWAGSGPLNGGGGPQPPMMGPGAPNMGPIPPGVMGPMPPMPPPGGGGMAGPPGPAALPPTATPTTGPMGPPPGPPTSIAPPPPESKVGNLMRALGLGQQDRSKTMAALGAGLTAGAGPGKLGAFMQGAGGALSGGTKQGNFEREQGEKEGHTRWQEQQGNIKTFFDAYMKPLEAGKMVAQTDMLRARAEITKTGRAGNKMWDSPFGRTMMVDREVAKTIESDMKGARAGWTSGSLSRAQYEAKVAEIKADGEKLKAEKYKQYGISPQQADAERSRGQSAQNPIDPQALGLTKEQFDQNVPMGGWFVPRAGAAPIQRTKPMSGSPQGTGDQAANAAMDRTADEEAMA